MANRQCRVGWQTCITCIAAWRLLRLGDVHRLDGQARDVGDLNVSDRLSAGGIAQGLEGPCPSLVWPRRTSAPEVRFGPLYGERGGEPTNAASRSQSDGDIRRGTDLPRAAEAAACAAGKGRRVRALRRIAGTQERRRFVQIFKASKPH